MSVIRHARTVSIVKGHCVLEGPVVGPEVICTGQRRGAIVGLSRTDLRVLWKRESKYLVPKCGNSDTIVLWSLGTGSEGWNWKGETVWLRDKSARLLLSNERMLEVAGGLLEVDLRTGGTLSRVECPEGKPRAMSGSILILVAGEKGEAVRAFDLTARRLLWERDLLKEMRSLYGADEPHPVLGLAFCDENRLIATRGGYVFGVSAADGQLTWAKRAEIPYVSPQVVDGRVYLWTSPAGARKALIDVDAGTVTRDAVPSTGGRLVILDARTGDTLSDLDLTKLGSEFAVSQEPQEGTLGKRHIAFSTRGGLLAVFRLADGELVFKHQHTDPLFPPAIVDREIYAVGGDGSLTVFQSEDEI